MAERAISLREAVIRVDAIAADGAALRIEATQTECAAIAERLGEPAVEALTADIIAARIGEDVAVNGRLKARVARACVASLEPMTECVEEEIAMRFARNFVEDAGSEAVEALEGETLDIGEFLVQQLSLALDPHPRKEGAQNLAEAYGKQRLSSPFEGMKALVDDAAGSD